MVDKAGRNDPCPCGSGKKYKNCCLTQKQQEQQKQQQKYSLGKRKFTAKVLNSGKNVPEPKNETAQGKPMVDYNMLMERSFGKALHSYEEKPPVPKNPSQYLVNDEK